MNSNIFIAITIISMIVGLMINVTMDTNRNWEDAMSDFENSTSQMERSGSQFKEESESSGNFGNLITSIGNGISMGKTIVSILWKNADGLFVSKNIYGNEQISTIEKIILFIINIMRIVMLCITILLIYDKIKNRKTD